MTIAGPEVQDIACSEERKIECVSSLRLVILNIAKNTQVSAFVDMLRPLVKRVILEVYFCTKL